MTKYKEKYKQNKVYFILASYYCAICLCNTHTHTQKTSQETEIYWLWTSRTTIWSAPYLTMQMFVVLSFLKISQYIRLLDDFSHYIIGLFHMHFTMPNAIIRANSSDFSSEGGCSRPIGHTECFEEIKPTIIFLVSIYIDIYILFFSLNPGQFNQKESAIMRIGESAILGNKIFTKYKNLCLFYACSRHNNSNGKKLKTVSSYVKM